MRTIVYWLVVSLTIAAFNPVLALEKNQLPLKEKKFQESYSSNVPVSGRVVSGVIFRSDINKLGAMAILQPVAVSGDICLKVQSKDGTYFSSNQYTTSQQKDEVVLYPEYPTRYEDILNDFNVQELALLAFEGSCSQHNPGNILLTSRNVMEDFDQNGDVVLFISSGRSDVFLSLNKINNKRETVRCQRIKKGQRTAYDTECSVSFSKLKDSTGEVTIVRRKLGKVLPSVKLNLKWES